MVKVCFDVKLRVAFWARAVQECKPPVRTLVLQLLSKKSRWTLGDRRELVQGVSDAPDRFSMNSTAAGLESFAPHAVHSRLDSNKLLDSACVATLLESRWCRSCNMSCQPQSASQSWRRSARERNKELIVN
eukprot:TRINITY_DN3877_c0_g1_i1.p1 TRINITY_DN3877_c0_g1~~TRINITY_DN3877_c0_g1_i1.p1  ORF type:complete len:131 (+),score=12.97 TRINITY_DN3877_c0_g1_i1:1059-1451(+)